MKSSLEAEVKTLQLDLARTLVASANSTSGSTQALTQFEEYSEKLRELSQIPDEIKWDMLSSSAFVTSISSTTGELKKVYVKAELVVTFILVVPIYR